jgi:hypothetical protein
LSPDNVRVDDKTHEVGNHGYETLRYRYIYLIICLKTSTIKDNNILYWRLYNENFLLPKTWSAGANKQSQATKGFEKVAFLQIPLLPGKLKFAKKD